MLFEDALLYPRIDVEDESWLKSAILLWDSISTIVPQSLAQPFKNECSHVLAEAGVLRPYRVDPYRVGMMGLGNVVRSYLESPEGKRHFRKSAPNNIRRDERNNREWLRRHSEYKEFRISAEKFGADVQEIIREFVDETGYVITDYHFMMFYMTALANNICQKSPTKALLTDLVYMQDLTDNMVQTSPNHRIGEEIMQQGFMYKYIIDGIKVAPDTPIDKLLEFRSRYKDERDLFKRSISDMIAIQNLQDLPPDEMLIQIGRLYRTGVEPTLRELERALKGAKVDCWINGGASLAITCPSVIMGLPSAGLASIKTLLIENGIKILGKFFNYRGKNERIMNSNPLSYLLRTRIFRRDG